MSTAGNGSPAPGGSLRSVTVVGASLAGVSTARALRAAGFDGRLTLLGDEPHFPYDRPPLSKGLLAGKVDLADLALLEESNDLALDLDLQLGVRAEALVPGSRAVRTADGRLIGSDAVVVATGARARRLAMPVPAHGVHHLRILDDALALRAALAESNRLVVVGGGFIGCEVASTAHELGLDVTVVELAELPLVRPLGTRVAAGLLRLHRKRGMQVACGVGVAAIRGSAAVTGVVLTDGRVLPADTVLVAVGSVPVTSWLHGSGIELAPDGAVRCDVRCRTSNPAVFAAGDVAAADHATLGERVRIEHWSNAVEQGSVVAAAMLGSDRPANGTTAPYFWSDLWGGRLQVAGHPTADAEFRPVDGDLDADVGGGFAGVLAPPGDPVATAVVAYDRPRLFGRLRRTLASAAP